MPISNLVIRITDEAAIVYDAGGLRHAYKLLGPKRVRGLQGSAAEAVRDGATLRLERSLASGFHIRQIYEFDRAGRRLTVTTIVSPCDDVCVSPIKHVYDLVR